MSISRSAAENESDRPFGSLLRQYRLAKMLSQAELAELASISVEAVSTLERGVRRTPQRQTVEQLVGALGLAPTEAAALIEAARTEAKPLPTVEPSEETEHPQFPSETTRLIGREADLRTLGDVLLRNRIVTITGSGGVGKTRVALELGRSVVARFPSGVRFVELAPLRDAASLPGAVASALGLRVPSGGDPLLGLARVIGTRETLVILDNCEHLIEDVARLAELLCARCSMLRIVTTSREPLGLPGEATYRLPSLGLPERSDRRGEEAADVAGYPAVALFVERAREADARFELTVDNASAVAEICHRLDGIPLAIELAAARAATLSPSELCARLDRRFRFLGASRATRVERHQTLRSLLDWSYELLSDRERRFFDRLSVFAGGFTLEAACAVAADDPADDFEALDIVESLVAKSLVLRGHSDGRATRYTLLETLRAYGAERLEGGGDRAATLDRFLAYYRSLFVAQGEAFEMEPRVVLVEELGIEMTNMLAALDAAVELGAYVRGAELLVATPLLAFLGRHAESIERSRVFLAALPDGDPALRSRLWFVAAIARYWHLASGVEIPSRNGLACARASGDPRILARALIESAFWLSQRGRTEAADAMLDEARTLGLPTANLQRDFASVRGQVDLRKGDFEAALANFEAIANSAEALGNDAFLFEASGNAAEAEHGLGRTDRAIARLRAAEPLIPRAIPSHVTRTYANLAAYCVAVGDARAAREAALAVLARPQARDTVDVAFALEVLALVCCIEGDLKRAALIEGHVLALVGANEVRRATEHATYARVQRMLAEDISETELRHAFDTGARLDFEQVYELARKANGAT